MRGAAAAGAGALGLAACSPSGGSSAPASAGPVDLGDAAAVPVGGGVVHRDDRIVVTQPAKGEFKAFSARCTHAGCIVDKVADGLIQCPCHGSRFRIADGSVADGPAPRPLPAVPVAVRGGRLVAGG
ncbi:Rieske (2Fe-2S) protein [Streptacidiphilus sp. ASG 303]|nr:Rieske (2Fe-2S) protein [Streptacidiphilus sp. ASG 303]